METDRIFYRDNTNESEFTLCSSNGFVAQEGYMALMENAERYYGEQEIIDKINRNEDGFFDFSKTLIDIGSEIGVYSRWTNFAYYHLFEGNKNRIILSEFNMLIGGKEDIFEAHNTLLSDRDEEIKYDGFCTEYSPVPQENVYHRDKERTASATYLDKFNIKNVGLIKIDVEGMEEKVLRGAVKTIIDSNYPPILFELWPVGEMKITQEQYESTKNFILSLGYDILWEWGDWETHLAIHRDKVIDIFYIATDVYASYFNEFRDTLHNFLPGWRKRLHIISDGLKEYDGYDEDGIKIDVTYQLSLPYPLIPLSKPYFIKNGLRDDMKYVFYFDADTRFLERTPEYWREFEEMMDSGKMMLANHPGNFFPTYPLEPGTEAYVSDEDFRMTTMSSVFGGKKETVSDFCDELMSHIKKDLNSHKDGYQHHYIPSLFDQDYVNRTLNLGDFDHYIVRYFSYIEWFGNENDENAKDERFIEQKYDIRRKFEKKNMI